MGLLYGVYQTRKPMRGAVIKINSKAIILGVFGSLADESRSRDWCSTGPRTGKVASIRQTLKKDTIWMHGGRFMSPAFRTFSATSVEAYRQDWDPTFTHLFAYSCMCAQGTWRVPVTTTGAGGTVIGSVFSECILRVSKWVIVIEQPLCLPFFSRKVFTVCPALTTYVPLLNVNDGAPGQFLLLSQLLANVASKLSRAQWSVPTLAPLAGMIVIIRMAPDSITGVHDKEQFRIGSRWSCAGSLRRGTPSRNNRTEQ